MPRINLQVPFDEKDEAKRLGARWDGNLKVWFVPDGLNPSVFGRWLPDEPEIGVRSESYFIARTEKACWRCGALTCLFGFVLPVGHETFERDDEDEEFDAWCQHDESTIVYYVTDLPPSVAARIKGLSRNYYVDFSKTTQTSYWMNHCDHCGMKQGDFDMYCEPGGAFFPLDEADAARIYLYHFDEPFSCNGSTSYGEDYLYAMPRA